MTASEIETLLARRRELRDQRFYCQSEVKCLMCVRTPEAKGRVTDLVREMNDITEELHDINLKLEE